jgi:hypothetical protein
VGKGEVLIRDYEELYSEGYARKNYRPGVYPRFAYVRGIDEYPAHFGTNTFYEAYSAGVKMSDETPNMGNPPIDDRVWRYRNQRHRIPLETDIKPFGTPQKRWQENR